MLSWFRRIGTTIDKQSFNVEVKELRLHGIVPALQAGDKLKVQFKRGNQSGDEKSVFSTDIELEPTDFVVQTPQKAKEGTTVYKEDTTVYIKLTSFLQLQQDVTLYKDNDVYQPKLAV